MDAGQSAQSRGRHRILIVDDHPLVRAGIKALIDDEPDLLVCGETGSIHDTLGLVRDDTPDIVIVDLSLPDGNGLELVKRLAGAPGLVGILVCSMHEESLFAQRALAAGAKGYLDKHAAATQVVGAIRVILSGRIYLSERMTELMLERLSAKHPPLAGAASVHDLSDRELEVFCLLGQCLSASQIAARLHLSVKTVEAHRAKIKRKLNLASGAELTRCAVQWALEAGQEDRRE
ncbi:response regulator transcription factor [Thiococcus pfennigii]|uniref:response regulator n=1 Tax=Thiococcus pfennigii TaxID=1057 RepID=UPI001907867E|nr:response regulator transcription factor [Thiococcus pfennigii]MBK1730857.1 DNA-binding response regulator [Thiococcus pfennigii]